MRKSGGAAIGLLILVISLAVVMILVARQWKAVAPTALQVSGTAGAGGIDDHAEGDAVQSGELPDLGEMQQATDEHAAQVQEALAATE